MKEVKNEGGKEEGRPEEDCSVRFKVTGYHLATNISLPV